MGREFWTPEREQLLRDLTEADAHHTATEIAEALSRESYLTVTRNSVIAKVHRLGLQPAWMKDKPLKPPSERTLRRMRHKVQAPNLALPRKTNGFNSFNGHVKPVAPTPIPMAETAIPTDGRTFWQLEPGHCRWPTTGEGLAILYCGAGAEIGRSYCAVHCRKSYVHFKVVG